MTVIVPIVGFWDENIDFLPSSFTWRPRDRGLARRENGFCAMKTALTVAEHHGDIAVGAR
jgi:hypothetical protein